ncbi:hypothetical protein VNO77_23435 [Canavalia gladiata]|uniref:Uncharacterized protein n=1 Tax=Canavalia gladiata TaxID=3824 RepID=A0AAN9L4E4_CANGL
MPSDLRKALLSSLHKVTIEIRKSHPFAKPGLTCQDYYNSKPNLSQGGAEAVEASISKGHISIKFIKAYFTSGLKYMNAENELAPGNYGWLNQISRSHIILECTLALLVKCPEFLQRISLQPDQVVSKAWVILLVRVFVLETGSRGANSGRPMRKRVQDVELEGYKRLQCHNGYVRLIPLDERVPYDHEFPVPIIELVINAQSMSSSVVYKLATGTEQISKSHIGTVECVPIGNNDNANLKETV